MSLSTLPKTKHGNAAATKFPWGPGGTDLEVWVGGRHAAESIAFLSENNIRFVVCAVGKWGESFEYPVPPSDDFKCMSLPIGYEGAARMESNWRFF